MNFNKIICALIILELFSHCKSSKLTTAPAIDDITVNESDSIYHNILKERLNEATNLHADNDFIRPKPGLTLDKRFSIVPVFFGTDRKPSGKAGPYGYFTNNKGNGDLHYGKCLVSVPRLHSLGEIERPSWWSFEFSENPEKHMMLREVKELSAEPFMSEMHSEAQKAGKKEAIVFIHGYNVAFDDAILRAAQLAYDLSYSGIPIVYSWPSDGSLLSYFTDEERNAWSVPHLEKFLVQLADEGGFDKIQVIAHSMGNRALTKALAEITQKTNRKLFDQVVLAAPDIDANVFISEIAPFIQSSANKVTLYASSNDKALMLSSEIHSITRIGEGGENLMVVQGVESIDASSIDTDFLGHSYFANTWLLINDIYKVINKGLPADSRGLKSDYKHELKYWLLK